MSKPIGRTPARICPVCGRPIGIGEIPHVIGGYYFHKECLNRLLSLSPQEFEEVLKKLPEDLYWNLKMFYTSKPLPSSQKPIGVDRVSVLREFRRRLWAVYHCIEERDAERWRVLRRDRIVDEAIRSAEQVARAFNSPSIRDSLEAAARYADRGDWNNATLMMMYLLWDLISLYERLLGI